ncbi:MAG TPA: TonB-dependent receptor [Casimicrobiaceae bacterium]|nr:TonB-dependent receptor [Casimicrobiaceae bacterium]
MIRSAFARAAMACALIVAPAARAASDEDLAQLREEIRQLRQAYEARIDALEARVKDAEAAAKAAQARETPPAPSTAGTTPPPTPGAAPPVVASATAPVAPGSAANAFNPAISAVLEGVYSNLSQDPNRYGLAGFPLTSDVSPGHRGLGIGESEFTLSANVDTRFSGALTVALTPENTVSVEEAYGIANGLASGVVPKFGRFFSGIGYLNEQHQHAWDFYDAPLAYQAFLGGQYDNDGLQVKWLAPTDQFLEFGAEIGNGDNFPASARNRNGIGAADVFLHTGGDVGDSHSWRAGLSYLDARAGDRDTTQFDATGNLVDTRFTGKSRVALADFVWKYAPHGNPLTTNFKLQAEYFWRREHGDLTYDADGALRLTQTAPYASVQSGGYVQAVYQFMPMWRAGLRYDRLFPGTPNFGANAPFLATPAFHPQRYTFMVDWTPSEFSRIRLQYARNNVRPDVTDNEWFLQYILTLGAHGAHKF